MKKILWFYFLTTSILVNSQVGIGTKSPNSSAILELKSSNKGFLPPRIALVSKIDTITIASPVAGLLVYNTATAGTFPNAVIPGFYYFNGTQWVIIATGTLDVTIDVSGLNSGLFSPNNFTGATFSPDSQTNKNVIYINTTDGSTWTYNGSQYVSYTPPISSNFYLSGGNTDAGKSKTATLYRPSPIVIGSNTTPDASALLDLNSTVKGFLPPRVTKVQRDAIPTPATGLMVFCTDCSNSGSGCLIQNIGTPASPYWECIGASATPSVSANCIGFVGTYYNGVVASGDSFKVSIVNNSFNTVSIDFAAADLQLSGVSGLTVGTPIGSPALSSGNATLAIGGIVTITYPITGTPSAKGTLTATYKKLGLTCSKAISVTNQPPTINCYGVVANPNSYQLTNGNTYSGTITIPYTATAAGDLYPIQNISSNGLSFTRSAGNYALSGNISYGVSGTYTGATNNAFSITMDSYAGGCSVIIWDAIRGAIAAAGNASGAAYDAAATNQLVPITLSEYNSILSSIPGASKKGIDAHTGLSAIGTGDGVMSPSATFLSLDSNSYIAAVSFTANQNIAAGNIKVTASPSQSGATVCLTETTANVAWVVLQTRYFAVKKPTTNSGSNTFLGRTSTGNGVWSAGKSGGSTSLTQNTSNAINSCGLTKTQAISSLDALQVISSTLKSW